MAKELELELVAQLAEVRELVMVKAEPVGLALALALALVE